VIKKFIKDNRGQVLYAVIVTVMFVGLISMTTMGLTLRNYNAAVQKQQHVSDYYAAGAVAELIRIGSVSENQDQEFDVEFENITVHVVYANETYTITCGTVTIESKIDVDSQQFNSWEVSYHAAKPEQD
jgi:hypothetical protein